MDKVLTISVAAYNVEDSLEETLNSLVVDHESMDLLEVLVVDDGSSDRTYEVAERFVDSYPDTFRLIRKTNGGYGSTINTSVNEARGTYFKQLDAGDIFVTGNLSEFIRLLSVSETDIVICPYEEFLLNDDRIDLIAQFGSYGTGASYDITVLACSHLLKMHELAFKTDVWKKLGRIIPEHSFYTDMEYVFYPLVHAETVSFYDKPVYRYYLQCEGQSVSYEGIRKHFRDSETVMWDLFDTYNSYCREADDKRMDIIRMLLMHSASFLYTSFLIAGRDHIKELKAIDVRMRTAYPELYKLTDDVKRIRLMRRTGFMLYGLYSRILRGNEG